MFVAVQMPFADLRPFVKWDTRRLDRPQFELGIVDGFVRSSGPMRMRPRRAPHDWPSEGVFAEADRFVRFAPGALSHSRVARGMPARLRCEFRRLYWDGRTVMRLEVGITRHASRSERPLTGPQVMSVVRAAASVQVRVASRPVDQPLFESGRPLARGLLRATSQRSAQLDVEIDSNWILPAKPLAFVEYRREEVRGLPGIAEQVPVPEVPGARLHHLRSGPWLGNLPIWFLHVDGSVSREEVRALRLHLMRLHAEREAVRMVLGALGKSHLRLGWAGEFRDEELLRYIEAAGEFLTRGEVYGHKQSALLAAAYEADDFISRGERQGLQQVLKSVAARQSDADADRLAKAVTRVDGRRTWRVY